jgi:hypothetical protein
MACEVMSGSEGYSCAMLPPDPWREEETSTVTGSSNPSDRVTISYIDTNMAHTARVWTTDWVARITMTWTERLVSKFLPRCPKSSTLPVLSRFPCPYCRVFGRPGPPISRHQ